MPEIAEALQKARFIEVSVTIPEGLHAEEVADLLTEQNIIDGAAFLGRGAHDRSEADGPDEDIPFPGKPTAWQASLEGFLFPDTYRLPTGGQSRRALIGRMLDNFAEGNY